MNIEKYNDIIKSGRLIQRGEHFPLLDLSAWLDYATENSAGFSVGRVSANACATKGYLDIHYPCPGHIKGPGHIKAYLRCSLPEKYLTYELLKEAVDQIFMALAIPSDETYEATFIPETSGIILSQHEDRDGRSDRLVSRK